MSSDFLDEWDESFLEQAIQLELDATCSRNPVATAPPRSHTLPSAAPNPAWCRPGTDAQTQTLHPHIPGAGWTDIGAGFSPPRELSQRHRGGEEEAGRDEVEGLEHFGGGLGRVGVAAVEKEREIERLKREVKRVSRQLAVIEHECSELKKEKTRKDAELKSVFSQLKAKDAEIDNLKKMDMQTSKLDHLVTSRAPDNPGIFVPRDYGSHLSLEDTRWANEHTKDVRGVVSFEKSKELLEQVKEPCFKILGTKGELQNNKTQSFAMNNSKDHLLVAADGVPTTSLYNEQRRCMKTVGVQTEYDRNSSKDNSIPHDTLRKLFAIWGFPCNSIPGGQLISKLFFSCSMEFSEIFRSMAQPADAVKVSLLQPVDMEKLSCFHETLDKVSRGLDEPESLFQALLDLGMTENVLVVCRSLRILRTALRITMGCQSRFSQRRNIIISQTDSKELFGNSNNLAESIQSAKIQNANMDDLLDHPLPLDGAPENSADINAAKSVSTDFLIFLVKHIQKIMAMNTDEQVLVEAVSIMNLVVMGCNSNSEKERFGLIMLENLPKYLHKDIGLHVQNETLRLLFLLFNCPALLQRFCKQCEIYYTDATNTPDRSSAEIVKPILEALADYLMRKGNSTIELKFQRRTIIILAFIASLGSPGAEILWLPLTLQGASFLDLITLVLASEIDEVDNLVASQNILRERFQLMREALILLNRLASNASCAKTVLGALTKSNASAGLLVDVASRISQKSKGCWKYDGAKRVQVIEAEVIDLARSFRTRVISFIAGSSTS